MPPIKIVLKLALVAKRIADALEKIAVGSLLTGIFQESGKAYIIGAIFLLMSLGLSFKADLKMS